MKLDRHAVSGQYFVRSLYFDDPAGSSYQDKEDGVSVRHKYRIRIYNLRDNYISLERKTKQGAFIQKESALLTRAEYEKILQGDTGFLLGRSEHVLNDFAVECILRCIRPEVIVDFDRIPFFSDTGSVRITFDMNIRSVFDDFNIFRKNAPAFQVMDQELLVMEVKYTEYLPDIYRAILPENASMVAASKYVMCEEIKRRFRYNCAI